MSTGHKKRPSAQEGWSVWNSETPGDRLHPLHQEEMNFGYWGIALYKEMFS